MPKTLLVVDDHPDTIQLITHTLRRHGYVVIGTETGQEGLVLAEKEVPDLILLDVMMPDMDGYEVCRRLKANEQLSHIPIIMFSAKTDARDKLQGFSAGADDYITKPTRPGELTSRIEAVLARYQPSQTRPGVKLPNTAPTPDKSAQDRPRQLIVVLGARGGVGTTTVAINLAVSLADDNCSTILADLDGIPGRVGTYLNIEPTEDIFDLLKLPEEGWVWQLPNFLHEPVPNLHVLPSRARFLQPWSPPTAEQLVALVGILQDKAEQVVVDLGQPADARFRPLLARANHILVCLRPERTAITAAKGLVQLLSTEIAPHAQTHALMMNFHSSVSLPQAAVESFLGFPLLAEIDVADRALAQAANQGRPLVNLQPNGQFTQQFKRLARQLQNAENREHP
ncbi:MAG: response regulator [Ardenticatenaceae bacterium]|nr:response regulator [Anaerolineales bacterium]MCB8917584.1 response regulator [Ardenticatenaceae bacterium]